ncbi:MAG: nitroreductase, partial [Chthonomonadaceae bacterium]|nr:nitroreductase [Chthonomonadaceae bacterium]
MHGTLQAHWLSAGDFPALGTPQEKLRFLLAYAVLAPSSHNSQPWRFHLDADHVDLLADRSRALPILDPQDRELIISCGSALAHLQTALRRFGYAGDVRIFPDPTDRDLLARTGLGEIHTPDGEDERLFQSLFARHTNRKPFHAERISKEILARLEARALPAQIWRYVVPEGERREALARLIGHADREQVADCRFRREMAHWIRPHNGHAIAPEDGIPAEALGMPGLIANAGPFLV